MSDDERVDAALALYAQVACPTCGANAGSLCVTKKDGCTTGWHKARRDAYRWRPRDRGVIDPWVKRMVSFGAEVARFYDAVAADPDAPVAITGAARKWADKINGAADLVAFRQGERDEVGLRPGGHGDTPN